MACVGSLLYYGSVVFKCFSRDLFSVCCCKLLLHSDMESLTKHWSNMSLNDREGGKMNLNKEQSSAEYFIAAKFLTNRALNIDVVTRTFNPLCTAVNGFKVRNVGDHILLFVFDNKKEFEKIFASEPWSFNKHLVVLQRFENNVPVRELSFTQTVMWVQIHDIPFRYMNRRVAKEICEVVGVVDHTTAIDEMEGGNFMRVSIDISLSLCHGQIITMGDGSEAWVKFRYERLPNICYWCGCLTHSDRNCEVWINNDGTLKAGDQEYDPWLRAPFTPNPRRSMVVVPGFYETRKKNLARGSRATELNSDSIVSPVHSAPLEAEQVQPPNVTNVKEVVQTNSDPWSIVDSQTRVEVESVHETCELVEVQAQCLIPGPPPV